MLSATDSIRHHRRGQTPGGGSAIPVARSRR
jgi:hypothetical protein